MGQVQSGKNHFEHKPLYEELVEEFCRRITVGRWPVGRPLKTEAMIATELGVSLGTVRRAFDKLERMELIDRTPGRGTIVREFDSKPRLASLTNVVDLDGAPVSGEISIGEIGLSQADDEVALELGLDVGAKVFRVERSRSHLGRVFSVETAFLPAADRTDLPEPDVLWASARNYVVFGEIAVKRKEYARMVPRAEAERVEAFGADADALLNIHRTLMSFDERPLEYCVAFCRLGRNLRYRIC